MCADCYRLWSAWFDYKHVEPIQIMHIGSTRVQDVLQRRRIRYERWRDTVLSQQKLIVDRCRSQHAEAETA